MYFILTVIAEWFGFMLRVPSIGFNPQLSKEAIVGYAHVFVNGKAVALPFTSDCIEQFENPNYMTVLGVWFQLERMGIKAISIEIKNSRRRLLLQKNSFFPVLRETVVS